MPYRLTSFVVLATAVYLLPHLALAAIPLLDSSFHILPQTSTNCALGWGGVLITIQNVMNAAIALGVLITVLTIGYAGILWVTSPFSPHNREQGRNAIMAAFVGLALVLSAWLIVAAFMSVLYNATPFSATWEAILQSGGQGPCLPDLPNNSPLIGTTPLGAVTGSGTAPTNSSAPLCQSPNASNPCSTQNLSSAFGSAAASMSSVCNFESAGGNPSQASYSDVLVGTKQPYSVGLFQTNLTNSFHIKVDGKDCSAAFSGTCSGKNVVQSGQGIGTCSVKVVDTKLYNDCVAAAQNPQNSIAAAAQLYNSNNGICAWANTVNYCGVGSCR